MLILFGATGYTGRHAARYLLTHAPADLPLAFAARDRRRLAEVVAGLGPAAARVELIEADVSDAASIDAMVRRAQVVITTVGPYAKYGSVVVDACVRHRVDYADITGETPWVRDMIDAHHEAAAASGTRIVPCCGMDSVPSDIGAMFVARAVQEQLGRPCVEVRSALKFRGGVSGGTIASMLNMGASGQTRRLADPQLLSLPEELGARYDDDLKTWTAPFVMAPVNTRVVRRSVSLERSFGAAYGPSFRYSEAMATRSRTASFTAGLALGGLVAATSNPLGRALVGRFAPKPGEGPSDEALERGFMHYRFVGIADDGRRLFAEMKAAGDPGYKVTITMFVEAGLALALERGALPGGPGRGGVLTPATALGETYRKRLYAAGVTTDIVDAR